MNKYELLTQAIKHKWSMSATYNGLVRHFSPHEIGGGKHGDAMLMAFQYAGQTSDPKGLPRDGEWRCFCVDDLINLQRNHDRFHTRDDHSRPNTCVWERHTVVSV